MEQLNIFTNIDIVCSHCGKDPGTHPNSPGHLYGFRDADTDEVCCTPCRPAHYRKKAKTRHRGQYSEVPIVIATERAIREFSNKIK